MPAEDVQARLAEVDAHLRDGIEGRCELGLDPEAAERETLVAFGSARTVAQAIATGPARTHLRPRLLWMATGYTVFFSFVMTGWRMADRFPYCYMWFFWAIIACLVGFASAAFRARRPAPVPVFALAIVSIAFCWAAYGATWLNLYAYDGTGVVPKEQADRSLAESRQLLADRTADWAVFDSGLSILRSPLGIEGLRTEGGYRAPVIQPVTYNQRPQYTVLATAEEARKAWQDLSRRGSGLFDTIRPQNDIAAILRAQADPFGNLRSVFPDAAAGGISQACVICAADLIFGSLGAAVFAFRHRRARGGIVA